MSAPGALPPREERTAKSLAGTIGVVVVAVIVLALLVDTLVRGGWLSALLIAPWPLLVLWGTWTYFAAPYVRSDRAGLRVRNPLRSWDIPWRSVADLRLRWQMEVHLRGGERIDAWALIARRQRRRGRPDPVLRELEIVRAHREGAESEQGGDVRVRSSWNVLEITTGAVLVLWAVVAVIVAVVTG